MKLHIEFWYTWQSLHHLTYTSEKWGYDKKFELAKKLFQKFGIEVIGNSKPPRTGAFEITNEKGELLYSKFKTGVFPNENIIEEIAKKVIGK